MFGNRKRNLNYILFVLTGTLNFVNCTSAKKTAHTPVDETKTEPSIIIEQNLEEIEKEKREVAVQKILEKMTLEQKIAQMLMPSINKNPNASVTKISPQIKNAISNYNFGGIILFKPNVTSNEQTLALIQDLQSAATNENSTNHIPLFIGIDQEGGNIVRPVR